jgi:hypothetical protein
MKKKLLTVHKNKFFSFIKMFKKTYFKDSFSGNFIHGQIAIYGIMVKKEGYS